MVLILSRDIVLAIMYDEKIGFACGKYSDLASDFIFLKAEREGKTGEASYSGPLIRAEVNSLCTLIADL